MNAFDVNSESRCMIPRRSEPYSSGRVIVERMPCMMIEWAPENRESIVASDDSTAALLFSTSCITVRDRTMLVSPLALRVST
ncbi:hypothetical protein D3C83_138150 [compost metagenome]